MALAVNSPCYLSLHSLGAPSRLITIPNLHSKPIHAHCCPIPTTQPKSDCSSFWGIYLHGTSNSNHLPLLLYSIFPRPPSQPAVAGPQIVPARYFPKTDNVSFPERLSLQQLGSPHCYRVVPGRVFCPARELHTRCRRLTRLPSYLRPVVASTRVRNTSWLSLKNYSCFQILPQLAAISIILLPLIFGLFSLISLFALPSLSPSICTSLHGNFCDKAASGRNSSKLITRALMSSSSQINWDYHGFLTPEVEVWLQRRFLSPTSVYITLSSFVSSDHIIVYLRHQAICLPRSWTWTTYTNHPAQPIPRRRGLNLRGAAQINSPQESKAAVTVTSFKDPGTTVLIGSRTQACQLMMEISSRRLAHHFLLIAPRWTSKVSLHKCPSLLLTISVTILHAIPAVINYPGKPRSSRKATCPAEETSEKDEARFILMASP